MIIAAVVAWTLLYFEMSLDGFKGGWHFFAILSQLIVAVSLLMSFCWPSVSSPDITILGSFCFTLRFSFFLGLSACVV